MTVEKLIEILSDYPNDLVVCVARDNDRLMLEFSLGWQEASIYCVSFLPDADEYQFSWGEEMPEEAEKCLCISMED